MYHTQFIHLLYVVINCIYLYEASFLQITFPLRKQLQIKVIKYSLRYNLSLLIVPFYRVGK